MIVTKLNRFYLLYALMALLYICLTLFTPTDAAVLTKYHLSPTQAKTLSLAVAIPIMAIWFIAFYGFVHLRAYVQVIRKTEDGKHLKTLSRGIFWLAISLPVNSIVASYMSYLAYRHPSAIPATIILTNYVRLLLAIVSLYWIFQGAKGLASMLPGNSEVMHRDDARTGFIVLGLVFAYITLNNPARRSPVGTPPRAAYYLPDILIILTIIIPYLWVWFRGLIAAFYLHFYKQKVKGMLYKSGLGYIANGLIFIIASSIAVQFVVSISSLWRDATLQFILIILYLLIVLIGLGFFLVAVGAKRLKKIEEV